jgi:hypothetical protein
MAEDVIALMQDINGRLMAIAAHDDLDPWPVAPDAADDMAQDRRRLHARGPLAGA